MEKFGLSYSEFLQESWDHPRKYSEIYAYNYFEKRNEAAEAGQLPLTEDENLTLPQEQSIVSNRFANLDQKMAIARNSHR